MMPRGPERRAHNRVAVSVAAIIKGKEDIAVGLVENISMGGFYVRLKTQMSIDQGEEVTVDIYLNESDQTRSVLKLGAKIVWLSEKGMGVQFLPMAPAEQNRLMTIIELAEGTFPNNDSYLQFELFI